MLVSVMAVAAIGFLVGLDHGAPRSQDVEPSEQVPAQVPGAGVAPAVTYAEIGKLGPDATR